MNTQLADEIDQALADLECVKMEPFEIVDSPSEKYENFPWAVLALGLLLGSSICGSILLVVFRG